MAEGKKGVLVYSDWMKKFESLSDEEAGRLAKHLFRYINDLNPTAPDRITELSFIDIELTLKRDLKKWEHTIEGKSMSGRIGNLKRWHPGLYQKYLLKELTIEQCESIAQRQITSQTEEKDRITDNIVANIAVNVNDNVNVNDINNIEGVKPTPKTLEERKIIFRDSLIPFVEKYSKVTVRAFYDNWSESSPKGKKMKFEMQKTFDISLRLAKWKQNEIDWAKKPQSNNQNQTQPLTVKLNGFKQE